MHDRITTLEEERDVLEERVDLQEENREELEGNLTELVTWVETMEMDRRYYCSELTRLCKETDRALRPVLAAKKKLDDVTKHLNNLKRKALETRQAMRTVRPRQDPKAEEGDAVTLLPSQETGSPEIVLVPDLVDRR